MNKNNIANKKTVKQTRCVYHWSFSIYCLEKHHLKPATGKTKVVNISLRGLQKFQASDLKKPIESFGICC